MRVRVGVGRPDSTDPEIVSALRARALPRGRRAGARARSSGACAQVEARRARRPPTAAGWMDGRAARRRCARCSGSSAEDERRCGSRARAGTRSCRRRCARTLIAALAEIDERGARAARRWSSSATTARRASSPATCAPGSRPRRVRYYPSRGVAYESHLAPPPHLVGLRVAALDALLGAGRRRAAPASQEPAGRRRQRGGALGEGARPGAAPALVHAARRRAARPRRVRRRARRGRLRARRPGRGARPVRDARRAARRLPGDRGARGAGRHVRRRDRIAALVLDVHAALARRGRGGRDRARRRARGRAPRARRDRGGDGSLQRRRGGAGERPDIAELLPGRALRRAARPASARTPS